MFSVYLTVFLISAATLIFEITLTRIFSVAQGYHFAFMAVSLALLGFGASGSALALFPGFRRRDLTSSLFVLSISFSLSIPLSYLVSNYIPFDSYQIACDRRQIAYLAIYYLSLAIPFFLAGLAIGAPLALLVGQESRIYFFNLAGSGLGCLVALASLSLVGGEGTVILASLWGALAALLCSRSWKKVGASLTLLTLGGALLIKPPPLLTIKMSPYKPLSNSLRFAGAQLLFRRWNAFSRVDLVESPGVHSAPGLSFSYEGRIPPQLGITTDGDNLQPLTAASPETDLSFLEWLPLSLPYLLVEEPQVLLLEPGGGLDLLLALQKGGRRVVAVEPNPLVTYVVRDLYGGFVGGIFQDSRVTVVNEIGRSYLRRTEERFDLIVISLAQSFRPVTSGAYSLQEEYTYTQEAFLEYWEHLSPQGVLVVPRWLQLPPSESVRALALAASALDEAGVEEPSQHIAALRSFSTMLLMVKRTPFTPHQIQGIKEFAQGMRFDLVYYPEMPREEANRFYLLEEPEYHLAYKGLLEAEDKEKFYSAYPFDISPPSDDRPFFFHFFTWKQVPTILANWGKIWQPFGGSGYLLLWALLLLAFLASLTLIILPLISLKGSGGEGVKGRVFLYFLLLGLGYLFLEIPLIQRFILFLGHPVYALGAVLFALLIFSGLGSLSSPRTPWSSLAVLGVMALLYPLLLPPLFRALLSLGLGLRLLASVLILAPLGFLMGVPFPKGVALTGRLAPGLIPWAWGINGCASVLSSILATMVALTYGFSWVLIAAGGAYLLALMAIYPLCRTAPEKRHMVA